MITVGTTFKILQGMPRECVVTRVVGEKVYFTSHRAGMEPVPEITTRTVLANPVMVEKEN